MKDTRGPDVPIPDSVPDELVAIYGAGARSAVRSRKSWRARQAFRARTWMARHDGWYFLATGMLWTVIVAGFGGAVALAAASWPVQTIEAGVVVAVAALSSFATAVVMHRRAARSRQ